MLPILQSSGFATVQSLMTADGADSHEPVKDFQRSDRFSSLVRDSGRDSKAEEMTEEKANDKASAEPSGESDSDVKEVHRQGEGDNESADLDSIIAALEDSEVKGAVANKSDALRMLTNTEQNHLLPEAGLVAHSEVSLPTSEMATKLIEAGPGMNAVPRQIGLKMDVVPGHSSVSKGTIFTGTGAQQKPQGTASVAQAAVQPALTNALALPSDPGRQDADDPRMRATSSTSQSVLGSLDVGDAKLRSATRVSDEVPPTPRMPAETIQTGHRSSIGEKPNSILVTERQGISTQGQPTPVSTTLGTSPAHIPEARPTLHNARESGNAKSRSARDLADLTSESEAPHAIKKHSAAGQAFGPLTANVPATLGQTVSTTPGNDELLRAGLGAVTEHHIQSTQSEAVLRITQVHPNELPRHIARQLAEVSQRMPDRPVEVALNPEELGRVRMSISAHDTGITMSLLAERQETLDLMRRHIDQLSQEFHALGFGDVRFSFSRQDESDKFHADSMQEDSASNGDNPSAEAPIQLSLNPSAGLDLRL